MDFDFAGNFQEISVGFLVLHLFPSLSIKGIKDAECT